MPTHYEWDIEEVASDGDIIDHHHADSLGAFSADNLRDALAQRGKRLVLVRDRFSRGADSLDDRLWCYVTSERELPSHFSDSLDHPTEVKVPKIFAQEFARMIESL